MNIIVIASSIMPLKTIHSIVDHQTVAIGVPVKKADRIRDEINYPFKMIECIDYIEPYIKRDTLNYINGKTLPKRKRY